MNYYSKLTDLPASALFPFHLSQSNNQNDLVDDALKYLTHLFKILQDVPFSHKIKSKVIKRAYKVPHYLVPHSNLIPYTSPSPCSLTPTCPGLLPVEHSSSVPSLHIGHFLCLGLSFTRLAVSFPWRLCSNVSAAVRSSPYRPIYTCLCLLLPQGFLPSSLLYFSQEH